MLRAVLVTELEQAIINKLRMDNGARRGMVLNSLEFPDTPEVEALYNSIIDDRCGGNKLQSEKEKIEHRKWKEGFLKAYREAGYTEPLEFGKGKAIPFLRSFHYGK